MISSKLVDLVQQLRGHLMELKSPKTKKTTGIEWDISRHERWLGELDPSSHVVQLRQAGELLQVVAEKLDPVRRNLLRSALGQVLAVYDAELAEQHLDAQLDKANKKPATSADPSRADPPHGAAAGLSRGGR